MNCLRCQSPIRDGEPILVAFTEYDDALPLHLHFEHLWEGWIAHAACYDVVVDP